MAFAPVPDETEAVAREVIGAAIEVHRHLGPGFLEKIYREALCIELHVRGIAFERERQITVRYKTVEIPGQRVDLVVDNRVVELKAAAQLDDLHKAVLFVCFVAQYVFVTCVATGTRPSHTLFIAVAAMMITPPMMV